MIAPRRPGDVPTLAALADVIATIDRHRGALVNHRVGIGDPLGAEQVVTHALADLAVSHALADRLLWHRWLTVVEALTAGATLAEVAAACGLDVDEVQVGLRAWADGQEHSRAHYGSGGLSPVEADEVRGLADGTCGRSQ